MKSKKIWEALISHQKNKHGDRDYQDEILYAVLRDAADTIDALNRRMDALEIEAMYGRKR